MEYLHIDDEIHLEKVKLSHAELVYSTIDTDRNYLRRWLPFVDQTRNLKDTEKYIKMLLSAKEKDRNEVFTVWYKGEFAGLAGFKEIDPVNHKAEIGYWLAEKMQGKGIMTRTVRKMKDYGFRNLNLNRIQIRVAVGNLKSAAIPKRLGFIYEGTERNGEFHTHRYLDLEVYSQLKKEWAELLLKD